MELRFADGVRLNENEKEYQSALQEYRSGLVIGLNHNPQGQFTVHSADCGTISYDLAAAGQRGRSGKLIFRDRAELDSYPGLPEFGKLNWFCSECPH